jgi:hypothetical protein
MQLVCPHCNKEFEYKKPRKKFTHGEKDPFKKLFLILSALKSTEDWIWIRRIAKNTDLKPYAVSYLIEKYLLPYVEILDPEDILESTGIKMKMFKLKNRNIDIKSIIEDLIKRTNS